MLKTNISSCQRCCQSQEQLLRYIDEVSFTMYDFLLYLDTHPDDMETRACYQKISQYRMEAMEQYAMRFGPLTMYSPMNMSNACFDWTMQPWPWEMSKKGRC